MIGERRLQVRQRFVDLGPIASGAVEQKAPQDALGVVEVRLELDDFAQLGLGLIVARGVEHDHGALEAQHGVVGILLHQFVQTGERFVEAAVVRGELGEDEFVGVFGVLLGSRRDRKTEQREQQNGEFLHCWHRITGTHEHSGRRGHSEVISVTVARRSFRAMLC